MLDFLKKLFQRKDKEDPSKRLNANPYQKSFTSQSNIITKINNEDIPYLIAESLRNAIEREKNSNNPKFHRTSYEEDLSFKFMMKHASQLQIYTDDFQDTYRAVFKEKDINKKIEFLQLTIEKFYQARDWSYSQGKGGQIFFQDMWEHLHNSRNDCFSYVDPVKKQLDEITQERDYIIPSILKLISENTDLLQKDIYQFLPDVSKSELQRILKELEKDQKIIRTKKGNSYMLSL